MKTYHVELRAAVERSPRVQQLEGIFDLPPDQQSRRRWTVQLPIDERPWNIGLIVGPSGSGKSTIARSVFDRVETQFDWPSDASLVDGFPTSLGIREIIALLGSVGFSSPPSWLRPYRRLSNGEQFRATLARALAERLALPAAQRSNPIVFDEFTSVVDRTVAKIGSQALAKVIRQNALTFVGVSCHYDVIDWLQPDWQYEPAAETFSWRSLQRRPDIVLEITRVGASAWRPFSLHHYLTGDLHRSANCFAGFVEGRPACFVAALPFPHAQNPGWREHRAVCLPDFQGVGLGNALSDYVASLFHATGRPYRSVTASPAMIGRRIRSPVWRLTRAPSLVGRHNNAGMARCGAHHRRTASFVYVGPARPADARAFGLAVPPPRRHPIP